MRKVGLTELQAVTAVAAARSFRAAAVDLGVSPSALSHAVAVLEERLGVRLFNRTTRSVALTGAGERFVARVGPALRDITEAMDAATEGRETPAGTLRINMSSGAGRGSLVPIIVRFQQRYPAVHVDVVTEGRLVDIVAEGFDLGVRLADLVPQDMITVPLTRQERFVVVGTPAYFTAHGRPATPADLAAHACLGLRLPSGAIYRWEFERHGEQVRLDVRGPLTLQGPDLVREAVLAGVGLGYMRERNVVEDIKAGRLDTVLEDWTPPFPGLCFYYPGHRHVPPAVRAFLDVARGQRS